MGGGAAVLCSLCLRLFGQSLSLFLSPTLQITPRQVHTINVLHVFQPNGNCVSDGHGLVTIRMKPDDHGRFGFNVKVRTLLISLLSVSLFFIYFCCWMDWLMIAYIAQFSALEQSPCTRMWFYMSDQLSTAHFWISTEVVYLQCLLGWCHMKLLLSWPKFCVHHTTMHHVTMQNHIRKVYACLAVTCHLHFWQNDRDLLHAIAVTQGWNRYQNKSPHKKLTLEKKISSTVPAGNRTCDLSITSPAL